MGNIRGDDHGEAGGAGEVEALRAELAEARAEAARLRPVYEAAMVWRSRVSRTVPLGGPLGRLLTVLDGHAENAGGGR